MDLPGVFLIPIALLTVSQFGVGGEKVPEDFVGGYPSRGIEVRVEWNLTRNVHGDGIPSVDSSDQLVKLYFCIPKTVGRVLLDD